MVFAAALGGISDAHHCTSLVGRHSTCPRRAQLGLGAHKEEKVPKHPSGSTPGVSGKANLNTSDEFT